eukprot:scaffold5034_cov385-Prasinococcus_capsulatus_cf.AAC.2
MSILTTLLCCRGDNVTYTVVIKPKQAGKFKPMQSQVTYVPETDGEEQFGVSTEIPEIVVMTGAQARLKLALFVGFRSRRGKLVGDGSRNLQSVHGPRSDFVLHAARAGRDYYPSYRGKLLQLGEVDGYRILVADAHASAVIDSDSPYVLSPACQGVLLVNFAIVKMRHAMRAQTQKRALRELEE